MNEKVLNMKIKVIFFTAMLVSSLYASDSFGGIGLAISQEQNGAKIESIIPSTPAAESNMRVGDIIIAVDGISLKGKTIEESKAKLRGIKDKPLEISFVSGDDTLSVVLRRTLITVKKLESERVRAWYGNKSELNAQEIETYASSTENNKQLVAVLQNGKLVKSDDVVSVKSLNGIYVDHKDEFTPNVKSYSVRRSSSAEIKGFSRTAIGYELKSAGKAIVSILNTDGVIVTRFICENALLGYNTVNWNSENVPNGRYTVTIEHNGIVSGKSVILN